MNTKVMLLAAATVLSAGPLVAATSVQDADGDGTYSYTELVAAFPELTEETYLSIDANADGLVSADEYTAAQEAGLLPS
ncbi:EF-hand domain-containing protein [Aliiroseovarius sp. PTFE2010]|uniref:EF-hand domain-containing protein n=1 Tax=Aliiroseovarius sp. PTFE2010 TaxID=3417190 RepID=UPI003CF448A9